MRLRHLSTLLSAALLSCPSMAQAGSTENISYSSRGVPLAASLILPTGTGPFPGVVLVHGSGSSDRSNPWTSAYADALVERGIAVLHPDKRGSGESGGDWRDATFEELAQDALAGLALLDGHPALDSSRVGFVGFSQGGYIVPLAALLEDAKRGRLGDTGVIRGFPTDPDARAWRFLRLVGDFDPLPYWRELPVPALFLYGGRDQNVDVYRSADIIEEALTPSGLDYSLLLFRNNGHALFREDAMDFIARWIHEGGVD